MSSSWSCFLHEICISKVSESALFVYVLFLEIKQWNEHNEPNMNAWIYIVLWIPDLNLCILWIVKKTCGWNRIRILPRALAPLCNNLYRNGEDIRKTSQEWAQDHHFNCEGSGFKWVPCDEQKMPPVSLALPSQRGSQLSLTERPEEHSGGNVLLTERSMTHIEQFILQHCRFLLPRRLCVRE